MFKFFIKWVILLLGLAVMLDFPFAFSNNRVSDQEKKVQISSQKTGNDIQVPLPPFSEGIFPCSECHGEMETNPVRRELDAHEDIVLQHDEQNRWCLDCHDAKNRDMLHLADGRWVDFKESYILCGQCHGPKLRDWRKGIHGRRTGLWNGQKKYLLCAHCHNPHAPRFKKLKPEPPPVKPGSAR